MPSSGESRPNMLNQNHFMLVFKTTYSCHLSFWLVNIKKEHLANTTNEDASGPQSVASNVKERTGSVGNDMNSSNKSKSGLSSLLADQNCSVTIRI